MYQPVSFPSTSHRGSQFLREYAIFAPPLLLMYPPAARFASPYGSLWMKCVGVKPTTTLQ